MPIRRNVLFMTTTKKIILVFCALLFILGGGLFFYYQTTSLRYSGPKTVHVNEPFIASDIKEVSVRDGRSVLPSAYNTPLNPDATRMDVTSEIAIFSIKMAYGKVLSDATNWSSDAALVYIKSLGVITSEGYSGEWQIVFGSKLKNSGYEILVYGDKVVSQKEISGTAFGYPIPINWYDSGDALISLRTLPQFARATVSAISFFYNEDGKRWGYALSTSSGTISMPVK